MLIEIAASIFWNYNPGDAIPYHWLHKELGCPDFHLQGNIRAVDIDAQRRYYKERGKLIRYLLDNLNIHAKRQNNGLFWVKAIDHYPLVTSEVSKGIETLIDYVIHQGKHVDTENFNPVQIVTFRHKQQLTLNAYSRIQGWIDKIK